MTLMKLDATREPFRGSMLIVEQCGKVEIAKNVSFTCKCRRSKEG